MNDKPKGDSAVEQRLRKIESENVDLRRVVTQMQRQGGFTDAKTLSARCLRIEDRVEFVEHQGQALCDVTAYSVQLFEHHARDRHGADLNNDNSEDAQFFRRIRRRLHTWAEKAGLLKKRGDMRDVRQDENRLRPRSEVRA